MLRESPPLSYCHIASSGAASTWRQAPWAGKPITAFRSPAQAPQLLQVASEYVAGQIAIRRPAGVYRGNDTVRSRHSSMPLAHYPLAPLLPFHFQ